MDLRNVLVHMRGGAVKVGDTTYRIDAEGVARDVDRAHAAVLLRNREAWQVHAERQPVASVPVPDVPAPAAPPPPEEPIEVPTPEAESVEAGDGGLSTGLLDDAGEDAGTTKEWPDPSEDLGIDYLREMAEAHGVKFSNGTKPKTLVKRLRDAMFE